MAAEGLGTLLELTPPEGVKPFTVQVTGPLIRIMGDRFPGETRAALLYATGVVMARAGIGLKPFVPQLQTTFVKSLSDQVLANVWHLQMLRGGGYCGVVLRNKKQ